ncbi:hypothetical protein D9615_008627 [Tricholomella constricta]|uniref:Reverse transcriptase domain-containing protein n=1 Tax=Tricholomella constricta TaxID=117010 RepID=A0A8H5M0U4_9AGAR|nr:hypothetical protein D9615_008627 [Tricholomella constricta]
MAVQHLQRILDDLSKKGRMPNLSAMQPMREAAPTHSLDYAIVTFQGEYKANPRPDYMSAVGDMIRSSGEGITIGWNIAPGYDKKRIVWFRDDHGIGVGELRRSLEGIFKSHHYDTQVCTVNAATSPPRVTFQLLDKSHIDLLMRQPPVVKVYALEVAVVGVATYNDPQMIIDRYLQATYGNLAKSSLIRSSRLVLEDVVYCVVLETPELTDRFIREPFGAFEGLDVQPSKPEYLYILNQRGFPTQWQRTSGGPASTDLHTQTQLDGIKAQQGVFQDTLATLAVRQHDMFQDFLGAQREMGAMFGNMISNVSYQSQLSSAQAELTSLQLTHTATHMIARLSNSEEFASEMRGYADSVRQRMQVSEQTVDVARRNLSALQVQSNPSLLPASTFVQAGASAPNQPQTDPRPTIQAPGPPPGLTLPHARTSPEPSPPSRPSPTPPPPGPPTAPPATASTQAPSKRKLSGKIPKQGSFSEGGSKRSRVRSGKRESMDVDDEQSKGSQLGFGRIVKLQVEIFRLFLGWGPPFLLGPLILLLLSLSVPHMSSLLLPALAVTPHFTAPPSNFRMMAANVNGFANPVKIHAIRGAILREAPHVFVLGETKSSTPVSGEFPASDYQLLDAPGVSKGTSSMTITRSFTPAHLVGRVLVCDLLLPDSHGHTVQHRVIALYAPWDPGGPEHETPGFFWDAIADICLEAPFGFSLIGDFNTVCNVEESSSSSLSSPSIVNQATYSRFLHRTNAVDAWSSRPDRSWQQDWTFKSFSAQPGHHAILDRLAVSQTGVLTILYPRNGPSTYSGVHHPCPKGESAAAHVPTPSPCFGLQPPVLLPPQVGALSGVGVRELCGKRLHSASPPVLSADVNNDDDFSRLYHQFGHILREAAHQHFQYPQNASRSASSVTNPTIRLILRAIRQLNRLISALKRGVHWPSDPWVRPLLDAFYLQSDDSPLVFSSEHFVTFLRQLRRQLHQCRYHEEKQEAQSRSDRRHMGRVQSLLHGGSAKQFFPPSFSALPLALSPTADDSLENLVTGPQSIRENTVRYFERLYHRTARVPQQKPWTATPSVRRLAQHIDQEPFQWPQVLTLPDLRQLLKSGNRRPAPGPDGWEKWWLAHLSDTGLHLVLQLLNYTLTRSCIPPCIKPVTLTTIHKRGPNTNLSNFRGITCSNLLANLPFAWLNKKLLPYLASHGIIPSSQVATQPGVQHRDLILFLAQVQMWATREHIPLYALQRDQKKGFDMLEPEGFYDALAAYHLPPSISLLDASSQREVPYQVKTAYGLTDAFVVDGVTKQGGSLSPLKCTITTSLLSHWLSDVSTPLEQPLTLTSHQCCVGSPHVPSDSVSVSLTMVEAMDDSIVWDTSWPALLHKARLADRFQATYGWETAWRKSAVYVFNADFHPPNQTVVRVPSVPPADPSSPDTIWNDVPVVRNHVRFLKVPINRPDLQFLHMRDIINAFYIPYIRRPLPFTALSRIISQRLVSKLRPCLQLQPIRPSDAMKLDHLIASKVHQYLGFPFAFSTALLTHPIAAHGFGFPSLALLNDAACISGLRRDLCHPVGLFRDMATITLNDWTCFLNACHAPVQYPLSPRSSTKYLSRMPASWIYANDSLHKHDLRLYPTDLSHLLSPTLALVHYVNLTDTYRTLSSAPSFPSVSRHLLSRMLRRGFTTLGHLGVTSLSPDFYTPIFHVIIPPHIQTAPPTSSLSRDWHSFLVWFTYTFRYITTLSPAGPSDCHG